VKDGTFSARIGVEDKTLWEMRLRFPTLPRLQIRPQILGVLLLIILLGAAFRFYNVNWDEGQHLHPDERFLTMVETSIQFPKSLREYFDTGRSPLNPYNRGYGTFVYGTFPLFLTRVVGELFDKTGYGQINLVGRMLSALFDLGTMALIFVIGRRLYGLRVGFLAALLLSLSVLNIQQSHFFTVDNFAAFFVALAFYFAVRIAEEGRFWAYALFGVGLGLAAASKIGTITVASLAPLAALLWLYRLYDRKVALDELIRATQRAILGVMLAAVVSFLVFRIAQPYAFVGPGFFDMRLNHDFVEDMKYIRKLVNGLIDYPPGHQWTNRTPLVFPFYNMVVWGMGLPLGLTAWAGVAFACWEMMRHRRPTHLLPAFWIILVFLHQGTQFVKSIRYFLPIYPFLAMMAAYLLNRIRARWGRWHWALTAPVVVGTFLWAFAFIQIYTRPVTRIAASRWMFEHIPPGSVIANEHWDDPLPLRVDGKDPFGGMYRGIELEWYAEDTPEKLASVVSKLAQADYIVLSSGRLYNSIPRLPMRYPMTTRYYRLLFEEKLGFRRMATFTSYPNLGPIQFNDDGAEEQFTVYDHPKVIIFQKTPEFDAEEVRRLLSEGIDWEGILRLWPRQATQARNGLMLSEEDRLIQREGGTWREIFNRQGITNRFPTLSWLLFVELLGLLAFPLSFALFRSLNDRGYIFAKTMGILLFVWLTWILVNLRLPPPLPRFFTFRTMLVALALLGLGALALARHQRKEMLDFVKERWGLVALNEALFLAFFFAFWLIRRGNPDLWHPAMGGEKPMDFAYLNAVIKSTVFPPYDPWFAGGYLNYYYFGQIIVGALVKFTGIVPWVAYNLAIPLLFALTAMGAFSVVYNLVSKGGGKGLRGPIYGLLGALFVAVVGNLGEVVVLAEGLGRLSGLQIESALPGLVGLVGILTGLGKWLRGTPIPIPINWWYWNASRVMQKGEINEFPFFTFLYADLHAHLIALPFALLALAIALNWALDKGKGRRFWTLGACLASALVAGELWVNNTWDYPTYLLVIGAGMAIGEYQSRKKVDWDWVWEVAWRFGLTALASILLYRPFHAYYGAGYRAFELWKGPRTPLQHYLIIHGLFLFSIVTLILMEALGRGAREGVARAIRLALTRWESLPRLVTLYRTLVRAPTPGYRLALKGAGLVALLTLFLAYRRMWVFVLAVPLMALTLLPLLRAREEPERRFVAFIILLAFALSLGVELVVLKGDIGRMNTVFKFYLQIWVLWGVAAAYAVYRCQVSGPRRWAWWAAWGLLFFCAALYPAFATWAKVNDRFDRSLGPSLDGTAYMQTAIYHDQGQALELRWDKEAIDWMLDNIEGSPVILEANTPLYRWGSRISIYTGLPTVIGWDWHQKQQRAILGHQVVDRRLEHVRLLYEVSDEEITRQLLAHYDVSYIYVGQLERAYYPPEGLAKFDRMVGRGLELVYSRGPVKIYRVLKP